VQIDYTREMSFVATDVDEAGRPETLGVVRAVADPDNVEAEFALLVRSDLQRHGLGRLLMQRIVEYLRTRGTGRVVGEVLLENQPMRTLVESLGFVPRHDLSDPTVVHYRLELQREGD